MAYVMTTSVSVDDAKNYYGDSSVNYDNLLNSASDSVYLEAGATFANTGSGHFIDNNVAGSTLEVDIAGHLYLPNAFAIYSLGSSSVTVEAGASVTAATDVDAYVGIASDIFLGGATGV